MAGPETMIGSRALAALLGSLALGSLAVTDVRARATRSPLLCGFSGRSADRCGSLLRPQPGSACGPAWRGQPLTPPSYGRDPR